MLAWGSTVTGGTTLAMGSRSTGGTTTRQNDGDGRATQQRQQAAARRRAARRRGKTRVTGDTTRWHDECDGRHNNSKGQHGDMWHDDGDRRQHSDGKGQQGDRRYTANYYD
jgi:hypothetical protein